MPFKSKAQQGFMFSAQARGDIPKGTAEKFAKHTKSFKALPEHKKMKKMYKGGMSYIPGDYERDKSPYSRMARGGIARQGLSDVPSDYEYKTSPLGYGHNPQGIGHMAEGGFAEVPHDAETEENPYEAGGEGHVICPACGH